MDRTRGSVVAPFALEVRGPEPAAEDPGPGEDRRVRGEVAAPPRRWLRTAGLGDFIPRWSFVGIHV